MAALAQGDWGSWPAGAVADAVPPTAPAQWCAHCGALPGSVPCAVVVEDAWSGCCSDGAVAASGDDGAAGDDGASSGSSWDCHTPRLQRPPQHGPQPWRARQQQQQQQQHALLELLRQDQQERLERMLEADDDAVFVLLEQLGVAGAASASASGVWSAQSA